MMIEVLEVSKSFLQGKNKISVLSNINLSISHGEIVTLLGKSGSGKTTLLSILSGLEKSDTGNIFINGENLNKKSAEELCDYRANDIGIVFQQFHLVQHLTAFENVMLPLEIKGNGQRKDNEKRAHEWLTKVGLGGRIHHFPSMLSGGEQQRVAIARAMVCHPKLILADEPSGNLDVETGKMVMDLLFQIIAEEKATMILVTHDDELARRANRIIRIEKGQCH